MPEYTRTGPVAFKLHPAFAEQRERERQAEEIALSLIEDAYAILEETHGLGSTLYLFPKLCRSMLPTQERDETKYRKRSIPHTLRREVLERDTYRCQECGDWHDLCVDHIIPERNGGPTTPENLQVLCRPCNSRKGDRA